MIAILVLKIAKIVVFAYGENNMTKDKALKIATNMLSKLYHSDNSDADAINLQALLLTAQADKDYGKMYSMLEELRKFIVKLQNILKQKGITCVGEIQL